MACADVNCNLANDHAFGVSVQVELSLARFELMSSNAFDESKFSTCGFFTNLLSSNAFDEISSNLAKDKSTCAETPNAWSFARI